MMLKEAVHTSEMAVYFNKTVQCYIPEVCNLPSTGKVYSAAINLRGK
jgi:hypothetical protein